MKTSGETSARYNFKVSQRPVCIAFFSLKFHNITYTSKELDNTNIIVFSGKMG